jgi:hypothetical protein
MTNHPIFGKIKLQTNVLVMICLKPIKRKFTINKYSC